MTLRAGFLAGAAAAVLPLAVRAQAPPSPSPSPSPDPRWKNHVHGANGVVLLPEHRAIEWELELLDGHTFKLSQYRRTVVVLNVFATWSEKCRRQQPVLTPFALAHPDDTAVFGISYHEDERAVREYRKSFAIPYPIAVERRDALLTIFENRNVLVPATIVFRPGGTLSCAWTGERDRDWLERERNYALASSGAGG